MISLAAYGVLIPFLGLYWDGWPYMYQYHVFGPSGFPAFVAPDRPHSAFVFMILSTLFGTNVWAYHIFAMFSHWLASYGVWLVLNEIWPEHKDLNILPAFLFAIYPGFLQQPISYPYSHHLSHLAMFIFSLFFMLRALRKSNLFVFFTLLSLLLSLSMYSLEYFATLELIRPFMLFLKMRPKNSHKTWPLIIKVLRYWSPFFVVLIGFLVWRVFIFQFPTYEPTLMTELSTEHAIDLGAFLEKIARDFYTTNVFAWIRTFDPPEYTQVWAKGIIGFWGIFSGIFIFQYLTIHSIFKEEGADKNNENKPCNQWAIEACFLGLMSFFTAGWVVWITKLPVLLEFAWDRLTLTFMFGASLLLSGLIILIFKKTILSKLLFSILIAAACATHFINALGFVRDWESFKDFLWQLSWRIPSLQPGTTILTTRFPLKYYSDNSLTAPVNWMFSPENKSEQLDYLFSFIDVRIGWRIKALEPGHDINQPYRSFEFNGSTSQVISIKFTPPGCVQIMDPVFANAGILPNLDDYQAAASKMTDLSLIRDSKVPASPPIEIVGEEPPHEWCYFFEKADLARQLGNWDEVIRLGEEIFSQGKVARIPTEWLPFLEAYLRRGLTSQADTILEFMKKDQPEKYQNSICYTLKRIRKDLSVDQELLNKYVAMNLCK